MAKRETIRDIVLRLVIPVGHQLFDSLAAISAKQGLRSRNIRVFTLLEYGLVFESLIKKGMILGGGDWRGLPINANNNIHSRKFGAPPGPKMDLEVL